MIPFRDERRPRVFDIAVWGIVAANVYVFFLEVTARAPDRFINALALIPYDFTHRVTLPPPSPHQYWETVFTSMFVHAGVPHIFFNMLFLVVFGPRMERYLGHLGFAVVYLLCGVAGGVAQILAGPLSRIPEIGASGAIAGILGGYLLCFPRATIDTVTPIGCFPLFLRLPALVVIGVWAAIQFFLGFWTFDPHANTGGVAYFAHIGGFSCGFAIVGIDRLFGGRNRRWA